VSETGRAVREYRLTPAGKKQLGVEREGFLRTMQAVVAVLDTA
jgi:DNA-binding PadR family transcriptional regulator